MYFDPKTEDVPTRDTSNFNNIKINIQINSLCCNFELSNVLTVYVSNNNFNTLLIKTFCYLISCRLGYTLAHGPYHILRVCGIV